MFVAKLLFGMRKPLFLVGAPLAVYGAIDPDGISQRASGLLSSACRGLTSMVVRSDLASMASQLESATTGIEGARERQEAMTRQREQLQERRRAVEGRVADNRTVLMQIAGLLKEQNGPTIRVEGRLYDRSTVEVDARNYLRQCMEDEAEVSRIDADIAEISATLASVNREILAAESAIASRESELNRFVARSEHQQLRRDLAAAMDLYGWPVSAERLAEILPPVPQSSAERAIARPVPGDSTNEVALYLSSRQREER